MAFYRSTLVDFVTSLAGAGGGARAGVDIHDIMWVWEKVPLSLVRVPRAAPARSSSLAGRKFWQGLRQAWVSTIAMAE